MKKLNNLQSKILVLIFALLFINAKIFSQGTWTEMNGVGMNQPASQMPSQRSSPTGFSIGGNGYIGTGYNEIEVGVYQGYGDIHEYNPASNAWRTRASVNGRDGAFGFSINDKGYIAFGSRGWSTHLTDIWQYDTTANIWTQEANFPDSFRFYPFCFAANGKGYIGSGRTNFGFRHDFWEFDPVTNSWTQKGNLSFATTRSSSFTIGNESYVVAGDDSIPNAVHKYDAISGSWTTVAPFPGQSVSPIGFELMSKGYCIYDTSLFQYDPVLDVWNYMARPPRTTSGGIPMNINDNGYVLFSDGTVFKYDPSLNSWSEIVRSPSLYASQYFSYSSKALAINNLAYSGHSMYDPVADSWTILPSLGSPVWLFSIGNFGYALSGSTFRKYDPSLGVWTTPTQPPSKIGIGFSAAGKGYTVLGDSSGHSSRKLLQYDPVTDSWTIKADYPGTTRIGAQAISISGKGYIVGGVSDTAYFAPDDFWEYDPASDSWTVKAIYPGYHDNAYYFFALEYNGKGYVGLGMFDPTGLDNGTIYTYDPIADSWTTFNHPLGWRHGTIYFTVNNAMYLGMGASRSSMIYSAQYYDLWKYTETPAGINEQPNAIENSFTLFPNPASNQFSIISSQFAIKEIAIFNTLGEIVYTAIVNGKQETVNCKLESGIYFVRVGDGERSVVRKLVVE